MPKLRCTSLLLVLGLWCVVVALATATRPVSSFKGVLTPQHKQNLRNVDNQPVVPPISRRNVELIDSSMHARIVGGEPVQENELPFVVALMYKQVQIKPSLDSNLESPSPDEDWYARQFCGGALIASQWVITAAHCILNPSTGVATPANQLTVGLGVTDLRDGNTKGLEIEVDRYVIHPEWKPPENYYIDVALIKLKTPVALSDAINKIDIVPTTGSSMYAPGKTAISAGWGTISVDTALSPVMRKVEVPIVDLATCNSVADPTWIVPDDYICAGASGHDTCRGDSGGPLFVKNTANIRNGDGTRPDYWLIGVVDGGNTDHICDGRFGTYTNVAKYRHWVLNRM